MIKLITGNNKNLRILLTSIFVSFWFRGLTLILGHFFPNKSLSAGVWMCVISVLVLLSDDGHLSEIYKLGKEKEEFRIGQNVLAQQ